MTDAIINDPSLNVSLPSITASLVPINKRLKFLPRFFGTCHYSAGENMVYDFLSNVCSNYHGAYYHFFTLSNGGFYLAPDLKEPLKFSLPNYFDGAVPADAAGIIATLYVLNCLASEHKKNEHIELYYSLRDFALEHADRELILAAID